MENTKPHGAPPGNINSVKHGFYSKRKVLKDGHIDKRSHVYRVVQRRVAELSKSLGGNLSKQRLTLIEDIAETEVLLLRPLNLYLSTVVTTGPIVKGRVRAAVDLRLRLGNYIMERLVALGLDRGQRTMTLAELLSQRQDNSGDNDKG